jgi:ketosteroid isomerase-like protein
MFLPMDAETATTIEAIRRFDAALNGHDLEGVMMSVTDDCVFENTSPAPDGERYDGAAAFRAFCERFFEANPHAKFDIEDMFATGSRGVVLWRYDWGHGHVRGVDVIRVRDGKVAETLGYVKG